MVKRVCSRLVVGIIFFFISNIAVSQIVLELCPITSRTQDSSWAGIIALRNNTGVEIDFSNEMTLNWPSLRGDLPWPFSNTNYPGGDIVTFNLNGVYDWQNKLPVGATWVKSDQVVGGYSDVFNVPTWGSLTQDGITYDVEVKHCNQTNDYELYDSEVAFDRGCFLYSPTENLCLGEAATEVWKGEGIRDVMMPIDRPSWAIGIMVAHRLFSNMVGDDQMLSPNFWTATSLNESRMSCDNTIVPNRRNHCYINSAPLACDADGVGDVGGSTVNNCYQVLNIGYQQISLNQPDLFAQTNAYGTASYSTVVGSDQWETGAIAVTYYHYQNIRYWHQIFCWDGIQFNMDAQDPYAVEKVFYHAFHDGPNAGISLLGSIDAVYNSATAATNMNDIVAGSGTWSSITSGSQKVANFTSLLDGNGVIYPTDKSDETVEYYGCYEADMTWADVVYYLDKIKILYPHLQDAAIQTQIQSVFNGVNGGADIPFSNFGPVIDEIVIQMGGHDPSKYLAEQYAASKTCSENPIGISLRSDDILCPGEEGTLQVWMAGDPNFTVSIQYPDGTVNTFTGIDASPYNITIDQPGYYEVVYFADATQVANLNCNFSSITVESQNDAVVDWNRDNYNATDDCYEGDLIMDKRGEAITVSYTKDGVAQTDVSFGEFEFSKTLTSTTAGSEFIITNISPNACGTFVEDTITFCGTSTDPCSGHTIDDPNFTASTASVCEGESGVIYTIDVISNAENYSWTYSGTGASINGTGNSVTIDFSSNATSGDLSVTANHSCGNSNTIDLMITVNSNPSFTVVDPTAQCGGDIDLTQTSIITGLNPSDATLSIYSDALGSTPATNPVTSSGTYYVKAEKDGCESSIEAVVVSINTAPVAPVVSDVQACEGDQIELVVSSPDGSYTYDWVENSANDIFSVQGSTVEVSSSALKVNHEGTYDVTATSNGCVSSVTTVNVAIDAKPQDASVGASSLDVCSADPITLNGNAVTNNGVGTWTSTGTGTITTLNDPASGVTGMSGGDVLVATWTIESENGHCPSTNAEVTINALGAADPSVSLTPDLTEVCEGETVVFRATGTTMGTNPLFTFYDYTGGTRGTELQAQSTNDSYTVTAGSTDLRIEVELLSNSTCIQASALAQSDNQVSVDALPSAANIIESDFSTCVELETLTSDVVTEGIASWHITSGAGTKQNETMTSVDIDDLAEGQATEVTFTVASANGYCTSNSDVITITRLGAITQADVATQSTTVCLGGTLPTLNGNTLQTGETASWSTTTSGATINPTTGEVTSLATGVNEFTYTIVQGGNCSDSDVVTITSADVPETSAFNETLGTLCMGESYNLTINPSALATSYAWSIDTDAQANTTEAFSSSFSSSGSFVVSVAAVNACGQDPTPTQVTVQVITAPVLNLSPLASTCNSSIDISDAVTSVTPSSATVRYYNDNGATSEMLSTVVSAVGTNTYYVQAQEGTCTSTVESVLTTINQKPSTPQATYQPVCVGSPLELRVSSVSTVDSYNWLDASMSSIGTGSSMMVSNQAATAHEGQYHLYSTVGGCHSDTSSVTVTLETTPEPVINLSGLGLPNGTEVSLCREDLPQTLTVTNTSYTPSWTLDGNSTSPIASVNNIGEFEVFVSNGVCTGTATVTILIDEFELSAYADTYGVEEGESVTLYAEGKNMVESSLVWNIVNGSEIGTGTPVTYTPSETQSYTVVGVGTNNCIDTAYTEEVRVYLPLQIPNAFSPNGDGNNETWNVEGLESYPRAGVEVYSRWGRLVYKRYGLYEPWDGTSQNGGELPQATYYYVIKLNDDRDRKYEGDVTLVK